MDLPQNVYFLLTYATRLVICYWLLVADYWGLVIGCWLLVADYWGLVIGCWLLGTG
jgi:hypothetical protein